METPITRSWMQIIIPLFGCLWFHKDTNLKAIQDDDFLQMDGSYGNGWEEMGGDGSHAGGGPCGRRRPCGRKGVMGVMEQMELQANYLVDLGMVGVLWVDHHSH